MAHEFVYRARAALSAGQGEGLIPPLASELHLKGWRCAGFGALRLWGRVQEEVSDLM